MANTYNTGSYPQIWEDRLQQRLNKPTNWKEVCDVRYSDKQVINWPYMSTEFSAQTGTRGTAYGFSDFALTNSTLTISTTQLVPVFIDRADLSQCSLMDFAEAGARQGRLIDEKLEAAVLATHASWTNIGDTGAGVIGLASTAITIDSSNIDDVVRGVIEQIIAANGLELMNENGAFFVWRAKDWTQLTAFLQQNGYNLADMALREGVPAGMKGYYALGAYHYVSNSHTAGHVFAGVRKILRLGILSTTYGQLVQTQDPNLQSGIGQIARVDYGTQIPTGLASIIFDVNVV